MLLILCLLACLPTVLFPQKLVEEPVRGAAYAGSKSLVTWGDSLRLWERAAPHTGRLVMDGPFGEGGCTTDLDRNGHHAFAGVRGAGLGSLLHVDLATGRSEVIDEDVETHDCMEAELLGHRGLLVIHRGMQVRFYQRQAPGKWHSRDIYSIYTPSYQGGLAVSDVDGDGRTDILCGNYWIRSPRRFDEAWRLFAIHTWFEEQDSATLRIVSRGRGNLVAAQAHRSPARAALFTARSDPRQQWDQQPLWPDLGLSQVHALVLWNGEVLAGENQGAASRWLLGGRTIFTGFPVTALLPLDATTLFAAGPQGVRVYRK